jgi:hypothetical protein
MPKAKMRKEKNLLGGKQEVQVEEEEEVEEARLLYSQPSERYLNHIHSLKM